MIDLYFFAPNKAIKVIFTISSSWKKSHDYTEIFGNIIDLYIQSPSIIIQPLDLSELTRLQYKVTENSFTLYRLLKPSYG